MNNIILNPSSGLIIVKVQKSNSISGSSVDIAGEKDERSNIGEVVAVGGMARHESGDFYESGVSVGDKIVFHPYSVTDIYFNNASYMIVPFSNVRAVIEEK